MAVRVQLKNKEVDTLIHLLEINGCNDIELNILINKLKKARISASSDNEASNFDKFTGENYSQINDDIQDNPIIFNKSINIKDKLNAIIIKIATNQTITEDEIKFYESETGLKL